MTISLWCLVIVTFVPIVLAGWAGYYKKKQFGAPDNNNPRTQSALLEGVGARLVAAQANAWEALAMFTAVLSIAHFAGADAGKVDTAAMLFVAARLLHAVFYATDKASLRSLSFVIGLGSCIYLVTLSA